MQVAHVLEDDLALAGAAKAAWLKLLPPSQRFRGPISNPEAPEDPDDDPPAKPTKGKAADDADSLSLGTLVDTMPKPEREIFFANAPPSIAYHLSSIPLEHRAAALMGQLRPQGVLNLSCPLGSVPVATALMNNSDGDEDSADDAAGASHASWSLTGVLLRGARAGHTRMCLASLRVPQDTPARSASSVACRAGCKVARAQRRPRAPRLAPPAPLR